MTFKQLQLKVEQEGILFCKVDGFALEEIINYEIGYTRPNESDVIIDTMMLETGMNDHAQGLIAQALDITKVEVNELSSMIVFLILY